MEEPAIWGSAACGRADVDSAADAAPCRLRGARPATRCSPGERNCRASVPIAQGQRVYWAVLGPWVQLPPTMCSHACTREHVCTRSTRTCAHMHTQHAHTCAHIHTQHAHMHTWIHTAHTYTHIHSLHTHTRMHAQHTHIGAHAYTTYTYTIHTRAHTAHTTPPTSSVACVFNPSVLRGRPGACGAWCEVPGSPRCPGSAAVRPCASLLGCLRHTAVTAGRPGTCWRGGLSSPLWHA